MSQFELEGKQSMTVIKRKEHWERVQIAWQGGSGNEKGASKWVKKEGQIS